MAGPRKNTGVVQPEDRKRITRKSCASNHIRATSSPDDKGYTKDLLPLVTGLPLVSDKLKKSADSAQLSESSRDIDFYGTVEGNLIALEPPFSYELLARVARECGTVSQCIECYVINADGFGHTIEYVGPEGKRPDTGKPKTEYNKIKAVTDNPYPRMSMRRLRELRRKDLEVFGDAYFEIIRNGSGNISMMTHIPTISMRITRMDKEPTIVETPMLARDGSGKKVTIPQRVYFRRYVQSVGASKVFFKELGDPRVIDSRTGDVVSGEDVLTFPNEFRANEVVRWSLYYPGQVYGLPRWIGVVPTILGVREAEMVNLNFFKENAIPAMAVLVGGGSLTEESFTAVDQTFNGVRGQASMNRVVLLEATADDSVGSVEGKLSQPRVDIKPLASERQKDALFQEFDEKGREKIRQAFRLPPIYIGQSQDYTQATATASMLVTENQVFMPERRIFDDFINKELFTDLEYWNFKTMAPSLAETEQVARLVDTLGRQGALTPNAVIKLANRMLDLQIESISDEWGDYPFQVLMSHVKNGEAIKAISDAIIDMKLFSDRDAESQKLDTPAGHLPGVNRVDEIAAVKRDIEDSIESLKEELRS